MARSSSSLLGTLAILGVGAWVLSKATATAKALPVPEEPSIQGLGYVSGAGLGFSLRKAVKRARTVGTKLVSPVKKVVKSTIAVHKTIANTIGPPAAYRLTRSTFGKKPSSPAAQAVDTADHGERDQTFQSRNDAVFPIAQEPAWGDDQAQSFAAEGVDPSESETIAPYEAAEVTQDDRQGSNASVGFLESLDTDLRSLIGG